MIDSVIKKHQSIARKQSIRNLGDYEITGGIKDSMNNYLLVESIVY